MVSVCVMLQSIEAKGTIVTNCASDEYSINLFVCVPQVNSKVQSRRKLLCANGLERGSEDLRIWKSYSELGIIKIYLVMIKLKIAKLWRA